MLRLLARDAEVYRELGPRLQDEHFQTAGNRKLFTALVGAQGASAPSWRRARTTGWSGGSRRSRWNRSRGNPTADYARDVWARLQEFMLRRRSVSSGSGSS